MILRTRSFLPALLLAQLAMAQRVTTYDPLGPGFAESQPPTALLPAPLPPLFFYPPAPLLPPAPALAAPPGDSTFNDVTGLNLYTNGLLVAVSPTPNYPPAGPLLPPFAIAPPVIGAIGGPATGIAIDPAAGILWLVSGPGIVIGVAPVPAMPILVPPFPVPFPTGPITGLEWDGMTGQLLACDIAGIVYPFFPPGVPAGPPFPPPFLPGPAGDVAIDKSGQLNAAAVRPVYVVLGPMILDVSFPAAIPFPSAMPMPVGLAYQPYAASNMPGVTCACVPLTGPTLFAPGPMTAGNLAYGIGVGGVAPGQFVLFGFDFGFNPAFPFLNLLGCGIGFWIPSPTLVTGAAFANAAGNALFALPLGVPPGFGPIYNQNFTFCAADPAGFVATPMQSIWASGL
jgi:hypothetical protein